MRGVWLSGIAALLLITSGPVTGGPPASARQRSADADYEAQEIAIYGAVLRHLLAVTEEAPGAPASPSFCIAPTAQAPTRGYRASLLQNTHDRAANPLIARYNRLASRHLRRTGRMPAGPRELDPTVLSGGLRIDRVSLSGCDGLVIVTPIRPILYGTTAFLSAGWAHACAGMNTNKFAVNRRNGLWTVEGYRLDHWVPGYICNRTPRSERGAAPLDAQFLLVRR